MLTYVLQLFHVKTAIKLSRVGGRFSGYMGKQWNGMRAEGVNANGIR